jgi:ectoine hydroxylase-related dioxygenase (phytanoyl-CoA dioxygenase family)
MAWPATGFLPLALSLRAEWHRRIFEALARGGVYDDRLLEMVPPLQAVVNHPALVGTLRQVLGRRYVRLSHNAIHGNSEPVHGPWHRDNVWGHDLPRCYTDDWAMLIYFPQDTPPELGPTAVMPGTQHDDAPILDDTREVLSGGPAGSAMLIHFGLWHRATPNRLGAPRYMLKCLWAGCRLNGGA